MCLESLGSQILKWRGNALNKESFVSARDRGSLAQGPFTCFHRPLIQVLVASPASPLLP